MNRTSTILTAATALALVSGGRSTSMAQYREGRVLEREYHDTYTRDGGA